jgi:hypothetical protein
MTEKSTLKQSLFKIVFTTEWSQQYHNLAHFPFQRAEICQITQRPNNVTDY